MALNLRLKLKLNYILKTIVGSHRIAYLHNSYSIVPERKTIACVISSYLHEDFFFKAVESYHASVADDKKYNNILVIVQDGKRGDMKDGRYRQFLQKNTVYAEFKKRGGLTRSWNWGVDFSLQKLKADYIFIVNDDIVIPKGAFIRMADHLDEDQSVDIVGPLTNAPGHQPEQHIKTVVPNYVPDDSLSSIQAIQNVLPRAQMRKIAFVNGFAMGFNSRIFRQKPFCSIFGKKMYFDPAYFDVGNEDEFQVRFPNAKKALAVDSFFFHYKNISLRREIPWAETFAPSKKALSKNI